MHVGCCGRHDIRVDVVWDCSSPAERAGGPYHQDLQLVFVSCVYVALFHLHTVLLFSLLYGRMSNKARLSLLLT